MNDRKRLLAAAITSDDFKFLMRRVHGVGRFVEDLLVCYTEADAKVAFQILSYAIKKQLSVPFQPVAGMPTILKPAGYCKDAIGYAQKFICMDSDVCISLTCVTHGNATCVMISQDII